MKNAKKRRHRVLTRLRSLDTPSALAVLMDRMTAPTVERPADVEAALADASRSGTLPTALAAALGPSQPPPLPPPASLASDSDEASERDGLVKELSSPAAGLE